MKSLTIRNLALSAGLIAIIACGGTTSKESSSKSYYLINAVKGSTLISANLRDGSVSLELARDVPLGAISARKVLEVSDTSHFAELFGGGYVETTNSSPSIELNVVVAMSPDSGPVAEFYPVVPNMVPSLVFFKDGSFGGASALDVYITEPGASLTSATPNGTITENGKSYRFDGLTSPTRPFEVRLTRTGTKDVVVNLGSSTELPIYSYRIYTLYHRGTTEEFRSYDFNSFGS